MSTSCDQSCRICTHHMSTSHIYTYTWGVAPACHWMAGREAIHLFTSMCQSGRAQPFVRINLQLEASCGLSAVACLYDIFTCALCLKVSLLIGTPPAFANAFWLFPCWKQPYRAVCGTVAIMSEHSEPACKATCVDVLCRSLQVCNTFEAAWLHM